MSSQKKARGLPGMKEMLDRQRVQQAAADEAKKLVDAAALAAERLVDVTKEDEETATYKDDPNWWTHSLLREGYGKDKHWVLLGLPSRDSA
jgi:RES domain-containing protein